MPPDIKHIILAHMNGKLYSCTLTLDKVVWQYIRREAVISIPASSSAYSRVQQLRNYAQWSTFAEVIINISGPRLLKRGRMAFSN